MNILKKYKSEIIISFATGIFFIYAERIFNFLGNFFVDTYLLVSDRFSNDYYKSLASNNSSNYDEFNGMIIIMFFSFCLIGLIMSLYEKKQKLKRSINKSLDKISQDRKNLDGVETHKEMSKEEMLEFLDNSETSFKAILSKLDKKSFSYFSVLITSLSIILLVTNFAIIKSINTQITNFKNDILKIEPYVSEFEVKLLKSNWAQMKNSKDFEALQQKLKAKKKQLKIR